MWIRTKDGWYIKELRGVNYVTWVSAKDKAHAATFGDTETEVAKCLELLTGQTGLELETVQPFV